MVDDAIDHSPNVELIGFAGHELDRDTVDTDAFHVDRYRFPVAWRRDLAIDQGREVVALLACLPFAESMRCHTPIFGLRLWSGTDDDARVSLCFRCNNIFAGPGTDRTFDGESPQARALLALLLQLAPPDWKPGEDA